MLENNFERKFFLIFFLKSSKNGNHRQKMAIKNFQLFWFVKIGFALPLNLIFYKALVKN